MLRGSAVTGDSAPVPSLPRSRRALAQNLPAVVVLGRAHDAPATRQITQARLFVCPSARCPSECPDLSEESAVNNHPRRFWPNHRARVCPDRVCPHLFHPNGSILQSTG